MLHLDVLKDHLRSHGHDDYTADAIVEKAKRDIDDFIYKKMQQAISAAVDVGANKGSADFINEIRPSEDAFELETESGRTDFSLPPYPNLNNLLKNPKVANDGSLYKVIPVGAPSTRQMSKSIFDAARSMDVERKEQAAAQTRTPKSTKTVFRVASSKQDSTQKWVLPAKEMDFTDDLNQINAELRDTIEAKVMEIINSYKGAY
jgi:hypothetical protein